MAKVEVSMPKMGESITEGTVIEWIKKPGDVVELDEALLEIGTDKVDTEVPSPAAGILAEIRVAAGDTVDVGTIIAIIETDVTVGIGNTAPPQAPEPQKAPGQAAPVVSQAAFAASAPLAPTMPAPTVAPSPANGAPKAAGMVDVLMPKMGESIMEGTVLVWHKKPGDAIDLDETLLEIATDKVDTEVPSPSAGFVHEILIAEGETVDVGTKIAVIATSVTPSATLSPAAKAPESAAIPSVVAAPVSSATAPATYSMAIRTDLVGSGDGAPIPRTGPGGEFFSPLVRSIADSEKVSLAELLSLNGSGHEGRVTKADLVAYLSARGKSQAPMATVSAPVKVQPSVSYEPTPVQASPDGRVEVIKMDRMRQIIAEHMVRSKATSAHVTSFAEIDVTNLVKLREANKEAFLKREGIKLTYTPFFVFAAVEALKEHPIMNASVVGNEIHVRKDYHIGIAVAIGKTGLVAPIIRDAGQKNVIGMAHAAADLAERARSKQLMPDQLQGGTFTVTNVGSLGSIMGTPIINQPQVAILATGAITKRPVVIEDERFGDTIGIRSMMYVSLSYDHRIVDGAMGSSFLRKYVEVMESFGPTGDI
ncbi:MAG: 2-oxoglutarate dehydrogenase, E2 component, dihydrolipoamide succinyltransferase [Bacteroidetes bacterium]|nr:2-oxoglutarate dehydrogenase, E2 component, dihydrolipoamide succinyltransferase [Bacteroidota bacterium]